MALRLMASAVIASMARRRRPVSFTGQFVRRLAADTSLWGGAIMVRPATLQAHRRNKPSSILLLEGLFVFESVDCRD